MSLLFQLLSQGTTAAEAGPRILDGLDYSGGQYRGIDLSGGGQDMTDLPVHGGHWVIEEDMAELNAATGLFGDPASALSNGVGFIAATKGGSAIDASLQVSLSARSTDSSRYYGVISGTDVLAQLASYVGNVVWECKRFGSVSAPVYERWYQRRVVEF